jgi:hypothetical protein
MSHESLVDMLKRRLRLLEIEDLEKDDFDRKRLVEVIKAYDEYVEGMVDNFVVTNVMLQNQIGGKK